MHHKSTLISDLVTALMAGVRVLLVAGSGVWHEGLVLLALARASPQHGSCLWLHNAWQLHKRYRPLGKDSSQRHRSHGRLQYGCHGGLMVWGQSGVSHTCKPASGQVGVTQHAQHRNVDALTAAHLVHAVLTVP